MGKPVLKNENDVERWRENWNDLVDQMKKDGLQSDEIYALVYAWAERVNPDRKEE